MDADRWERLQSIFHAAADLPSGEQRDFVENACADDPSLAADAFALLAADARGNALLDRGVGESANAVLDRGDNIPSRQFGPYRITRCSAKAGWASSTSPNGATSAPLRRSRSCATHGPRPRDASDSPRNNARWPH
ncbi:MAG: hypothetical protein ABI442_06970 [Gemmatimonadaceae bacterium]